MSFKAGIVGARQRRRGTGEYVARELHRLGVDVRAIAGTSTKTVELARRALASRYGIESRGYVGVEAMLLAEDLDLLAVCSPPEVHREALDRALTRGLHVFCEKPLFWEEGLEDWSESELFRETERIAGAFRAAGRLLWLNNQWPCTLDAFRSIHPSALRVPGAMEQFRMELAPTSEGARMVVDSASHVLSMLVALAGAGSVEDVEAEYVGPRRERLELRFGYCARGGTTAVTVVLTRTPEPPRPAAYEVNGLRVEREVRLPEYELELRGAGRSVKLPDPLGTHVERFLAAVKSGCKTEPANLVAGMIGLSRLVRAARLLEREKGVA